MDKSYYFINLLSVLLINSLKKYKLVDHLKKFVLPLYFQHGSYLSYLWVLFDTTSQFVAAVSNRIPHAFNRSGAT